MSKLPDFRMIFWKEEKQKTKRVASMNITSHHVVEKVMTVCLMMVKNKQYTNIVRKVSECLIYM